MIARPSLVSLAAQYAAALVAPFSRSPALPPIVARYSRSSLCAHGQQICNSTAVAMECSDESRRTVRRGVKARRTIRSIAMAGRRRRGEQRECTVELDILRCVCIDIRALACAACCRLLDARVRSRRVFHTASALGAASTPLDRARILRVRRADINRPCRASILPSRNIIRQRPCARVPPSRTAAIDSRTNRHRTAHRTTRSRFEHRISRANSR
jgi:hypothetical protein